MEEGYILDGATTLPRVTFLNVLTRTDCSSSGAGLRVAMLDLILIKMAVCELKYFPTIPVKVSINEYIDISKLYSTPKSKDFVNGVLDKVKNDVT